VELRSCLTCGKVGCCNDSANKHAAAHFEDSGHPLIRTVEPGDNWNYCFVDQVLVDIGRAGRPGTEDATEQGGEQDRERGHGVEDGEDPVGEHAFDHGKPPFRHDDRFKIGTHAAAFCLILRTAPAIFSAFGR
jgi:hypothetical protein